MSPEDRQQALLQAHFLQAYQRARDNGDKSLAYGIYLLFCQNWPDEMLDWSKILGGSDQ